MGLSIGMDPDDALLHWARWDGEKLTGWDMNERLDRILTDVHAGHSGFLTVERHGADLRLHALDGTVIAEREPAEGEEEAYWDYGCGFVDAATVIASTADSDGYPSRARHWLLDAHTLRVRGVVAYPSGPVDGDVHPLGDGTWLTYDDKSETLHHWAEAAAPGTR